jgi:hypothetical protein
MSDLYFIRDYVHACLTGSQGAVDCAPVWQLGVIGVGLALAGLALAAVLLSRLRGTLAPRPQPVPARSGALPGAARAGERA